MFLHKMRMDPFTKEPGYLGQFSLNNHYARVRDEVEEIFILGKLIIFGKENSFIVLLWGFWDVTGFTSVAQPFIVLATQLWYVWELAYI